MDVSSSFSSPFKTHGLPNDIQQATATYTLFTSGWLTLQAIPLLLTPSILLPLLTTTIDSHPPPLATYLSRTLALTQLALAWSSLLLSGLLPLSKLLSVDPAVATAYASPMTLITTLFHFAAAFHCYTAYTGAGSEGLAAFALGAFGSAVLAAMGTWCLLFAEEPEKKSKRTGKDKRTSGWPFGDKKGRKEGLKEDKAGIELKEM
jgi:hypothetical protein